VNIIFVSDTPSKHFVTYPTIDFGAFNTQFDELRSNERTLQVILDLETTGLTFNKNETLLIALAPYDLSVYYVIDWVSVFKSSYDLSMFQRSLKDCMIYGHNLGFDLPFMMERGFSFKPDHIYDTMIVEQTLVKGTMLSVSLLNTIDRRCKVRPLDKEIRKEFPLMSPVHPTFSDRHIKYACEDLAWIPQIEQEQLSYVHKYNQLELIQLNNKMVYVNAKMKVAGMPVNEEKWMSLYRDHIKRADELEVELDEELNKIGLKQRKRLKERTTQLGINDTEVERVNKNIGNINYGSSSQLLDIFYTLGIPRPRKDKEDKDSMGEASVRQYMIERKKSIIIPFLNKLLEYKDVSKRANTFGKRWIDEHLDSDGKIRADFKINSTTTGRMSCIEENQLVITNYGYKKIKDIESDHHKVLTIDSEGKFTYQKVEAVLRRGFKFLYKIKFNTSFLSIFTSILATGDHRIRLNDGITWKRVDELVAGDILFGSEVLNDYEKRFSKKHIVVNKIEEYGYDMTYDLSVENNHNFFASGVNVHNCSSPNLQQIPRLAQFRQCFEAPSGYKMWTADYASAELRIMASLSGDAVMLDLLAKDADLHGYCATKVYRYLYNDPEAIVDKKNHTEFRTAMKNVIFGLSYGAGIGKIAELLDISKSRAEEVYKLLFDIFPSAFAFLESNADIGGRNGYIVFDDVLNQIRWFPELLNGNRSKTNISIAQRASKNSPIQGVNGQMVKKALVDIDRYIEEKELSSHIISTVHDEIVVLVAEGEEEHCDNFGKLMRDAGSYFLKGIEMGIESELANSWSK